MTYTHDEIERLREVIERFEMPEVASVDAAFAERVSGFIDRYRSALESLAKR